ncbi:MAG: UDP-N-acetylmuramoyl-tripeptide--D-alanyl-D-alanine ligase [Campylobacter sp.]|nr:UDP-N-acetylmuramoyl-tripeptide--D-alanyl-D-alanine ligase [Campylobacter sp.]
MIGNLSNLLFVFGLGYYLITSLQFFSYKFERILFHYTKPLWHLYFAIIPIICYFAFSFLLPNLTLFVGIIYIVALFFWQKNLDKKLVFTPRVKTFFVILILVTLFLDFVLANKARISPLFLPLFISFLISYVYEKYKFTLFKKSAIKKLNSFNNLTIIQITASYGKTSIKNFLFELLKDDFITYKTPRSVNTYAGIIKDINDDLPSNTKIYIAESGARKSGDILEITKLLNPQIVIVGEIGSQHIEYFKTVENIRNTKLEILQSSRLKKAFIHSSSNLQSSDKITIYDSHIKEIKSDLDGLEFSLDGFEFRANILGEFNAQNLSVCIMAARYLGVSDEKIKQTLLKLKNPPHRLERIDNGGKIIIDDSFNGNLKGMLKSYDLAAKFGGRKAIITPGIVESTKEDNEILAKKIDEIFDVVVVTGELNREIFASVISKDKLTILKDKSKLVEFLGKNTKAGDLILFSNDAPSFI